MADNVVPLNSGVKLWDNFKNFLAGFGVVGRDKAESQIWWLNPLDIQQLEAAYRGDWIARKIIDIPAFDSTRAWRIWNADKAAVTELEKLEQDLFIQRKLMLGIIRARLYGGAALIIGVDDGRGFNQELNLDAVKKGSLKFVHVVSRWMLTAGAINRDITSPWFGEPTYYSRAGSFTPPPIGGVTEPERFTEFGPPQSQIYIHPSRVVRLIGADYPDLDRAGDAWSDSVLQYVQSAVKGAALVHSSLGQLIAEAKIDVIKVPGLTEGMSTLEGAMKFQQRFANANAAKSVVNSLLLDATEEWDRKEIRFNQMDRIMQMFLLLCCGAADIPATRFLGREPAGQNATGESDTRNYYDRLHSDQKMRLTPALKRLDEVIIRSALGDKPDDIDYEWRSLWQMDDAQKADMNFKVAQAHAIDVNSGLISPMVLKQAREQYLIQDGFMYPGIEGAIEQFEKENNEFGEMVHEAGIAGMERLINPPMPGEPGGPPLPMGPSKPGAAKPNGGRPGG